MPDKLHKYKITSHDTKPGMVKKVEKKKKPLQLQLRILEI